LGSAKDYVYIITPYLILDNTMITAITSAAKAGVDVRIITPKVGDKWYVHPVTQFNYQELLEAGVRIFEYTPGFVHSKLFVSDDAVATCGTVNMDYRSYYFHFECGVWTCSTDAVLDMKNDFFKIQHVSQEITLKKWAKRPIRKRFFQALLNVFAPFM
jgi:cardiolipin synthase